MVSGRSKRLAIAFVPLAVIGAQAASAQTAEPVQAAFSLVPIDIDLTEFGPKPPLDSKSAASFTIAAISGETRGAKLGRPEWPGARTEVVGFALSGKGYFGEHELTASLASFETVRQSDPRLAGALAFRAPMAVFGQFTRPGYGLQLIDGDAMQIRQPTISASLAFALPGSFRIEATHSDTLGDPDLDLVAMQGNWQSRSDTISLVTDLPRGWQLRAQSFQGRTIATDNAGGTAWIDTSYRAGSAMVSRSFGTNQISARFDAFAAHNRGSLVDARDNEQGWALSLAASRKLGPMAVARAEYVHLESRRAVMPASVQTVERTQDQVQLSMQVKW